MNKSTKIRLNYLLGIALSVLLMWSIGSQVYRQLKTTDAATWQHTGPVIYGILCLLLFPINIGLEAKKWQLLVLYTQPISFMEALKSVLCGIAFSIVTPNRIGEYPGRIIALKQKNTLRLVSVSILGVFSQLLALLSFGLLGLIYYNIAFPGKWPAVGLAATVAAIAILAFLYWKYEWWSRKVENISWLKKFERYSQMVKRFTAREQLIIITISIVKFAVFTTQYVLLLKWLNVQVPFAEGFCMASLFFWAITIVPSVTFAEMGIRAQLSLFLFQKYSINTIGIVGATLGLWCINLVLPAIIGSILLSRARLL